MAYLWRCKTDVLYSSRFEITCTRELLKHYIAIACVSSAVHATSDSSGSREDYTEAQPSSSLSKQEEGQGNNASNGHIV